MMKELDAGRPPPPYAFDQKVNELTSYEHVYYGLISYLSDFGGVGGAAGGPQAHLEVASLHEGDRAYGPATCMHVNVILQMIRAGNRANLRPTAALLLLNSSPISWLRCILHRNLVPA